MPLTSRTAAATAALAALSVLTGSLTLDLLTSPAAHAQRFNPATASPSLGEFPGAVGTYTFSTDTVAVYLPGSGFPPAAPQYKYVPVVTGPGGYTRYGVIKNGCAVFTYENIGVPPGCKLIGKGSRPLVLLARVSVVVLAGGSITSRGGNGQGVDVGGDILGHTFSTPGGVGGAGGGAGGNGISQSPGSYMGPTDGAGPGRSSLNYAASGGAGFGGYGGSGGFQNFSGGPGAPFSYLILGAPGIPYGGLPSTLLQGGSGAGGARFGGGGGGGGALEIGAGTEIVLFGSGSVSTPTISVRGGAGAVGSGDTNNAHSTSGGGSGGTIYLAAPSVSLMAGSAGDSPLDARGGNAPSILDMSNGPTFGGPGSGGRIRIEYNTTISAATRNAPEVAPGSFSPVPYPAPPASAYAQYGVYSVAPLSPAVP